MAASAYSEASQTSNVETFCENNYYRLEFVKFISERWDLEFSSYKIALQNRVKQNGVTLSFTNSNIFIEILLSSYYIDFMKY